MNMFWICVHVLHSLHPSYSELHPLNIYLTYCNCMIVQLAACIVCLRSLTHVVENVLLSACESPLHLEPHGDTEKTEGGILI